MKPPDENVARQPFPDGPRSQTGETNEGRKKAKNI